MPVSVLINPEVEVDPHIVAETEALIPGLVDVFNRITAQIGAQPTINAWLTVYLEAITQAYGVERAAETLRDIADRLPQATRCRDALAGQPEGHA